MTDTNQPTGSKFASLGGAQTAANVGFTKGSADAWQGRLRIQRDF